MTTGKAAVALGAAALLGGQLPKIQPLDAGDPEDDDVDEQPQPAGGMATVSMTYVGTDGDESVTSGVPVDDEVPEMATPDDERHLIDLELVPIEWVISELSTTPSTNPLDNGTPLGNRQTVSVMSVGRHHHVHVWTDQQGSQAILPASPTRPIVIGTQVDVEALEDAVGGVFGLGNFTINANGHTYGLMAFGSRSMAPPQDEDNDGDL